MIRAALDAATREAGPRIVAALAARYRDLEVAEEGFAEACARAAEHWPERGVPGHPAGWLYRSAEHAALDLMRKRRVRERLAPDLPEPPPDPEQVMTSDEAMIPDERLRLIFICCHPAIAPESRAALTLRLVCGLRTEEIAHAFLLPVPTLAQRLARAKRKIAAAGVPFAVPGPEAWPERLEAVLSTIEIAYSKAHEDAARAGPHAGLAAEMVDLACLLSRLVPQEAEVHALAAMLLYAEARRPARLSAEGMMIPLSEQDPRRWCRSLIDAADAHMEAALAGPISARTLQAALHRAWCRRASLSEAPPWKEILSLYGAMLALRDDPVVRINRLVAVAEIFGPEAALAELEELEGQRLRTFLPFQALRADLLRRCGRRAEARAAYAAALSLNPSPAEARWLHERMEEAG